MGRRRRYILKNYDTPLVEFLVEEDAYKNLSCVVVEADRGAQNQFPVELLDAVEPTGESVLRWLSGRTIPKNRRFVDKILGYAGLGAGDVIGVIDLCKALSVNDAFWVAGTSDRADFGAVNLYDNELDEALAVVAYTGHDSGQRRKLGLSTEWTTSGQFPKAWRRIRGQLTLYKAGTEGFGNAGLEPYSEFFAAQIAAAMGVDAVGYDLDRWHGRLASTCVLMNDKDTALVPFYLAAGQSVFPRNLGAGALVDGATFEMLRSMTVFDALICNIDRHGANYGFLRDNKSGLFLGLAPLYDHNLSLFAYDTEDDFAAWEDGSRARALDPRTGTTTFDEQASFVMGELQHEQLRNLIGFELSNHPAHPVSERRLASLNAYLAARTKVLLRMPVVSSKAIARDFAALLPSGERRPPAVALRAGCEKAPAAAHMRGARRR